MSTQTEHLGLHQWEAGDDFLRSDFNEDFAKIDAGVKAADAGVAEAKALATRAPVSGTYDALGSQPVHVSVGFRPRLVFFRTTPRYPTDFGFATPAGGGLISVYSEGNAANAALLFLEFTDDGFTIPANTYIFNGIIKGITYCAIP